MENIANVQDPVFVTRLGHHHFSHLRSVAEGLLDVQESAKRFLGVEHGHQIAHQQTADAVRKLSRHRKDKSWRLIGLFIKFSLTSDSKSVRRQNLRQCQMSLLDQLESIAAEIPLASDSVSDWFDDATSRIFFEAGIETLNDLNLKININEQWFRNIGIGISKARRIKYHLTTQLLGHQFLIKKEVFSLSPIISHTLPSMEIVTNSCTPYQFALPLLSKSTMFFPESKDVDAIELWISARAGSKLTASMYRRETMRFILWLKYECKDKPLSKINVNDCCRYIVFLQNIPLEWISRVHAKPYTPGWRPFRGPLSHKSQTQAIIIIASLFTWLQSAQYISINPWIFVNRKTGDDSNKKMLDTKAFSELAVFEIIQYIEKQPPSPARSRIKFIIRFVESVGLRSAELLSARLSDFSHEQEGWVMQVHGKGSKNRIVHIPMKALNSLQEYLKERGLNGIESVSSDAPLLTSTIDPTKTITYQSLYKHVKIWLTHSISNSALSLNERSRLSGASTHWLRHTFGTRSIAKNVPIDVIQAQMGHASIQTTTSIYGRAPIKRRAEELNKAFS